MTLERESVLTLSVHLVLQAHPDTMKLTKVEELLELQVSSITVCVNEQHQHPWALIYTCICLNNYLSKISLNNYICGVHTASVSPFSSCFFFHYFPFLVVCYIYIFSMCMYTFSMCRAMLSVRVPTTDSMSSLAISPFLAKG